MDGKTLKFLKFRCTRIEDQETITRLHGQTETVKTRRIQVSFESPDLDIHTGSK